MTNVQQTMDVGAIHGRPVAVGSISGNPVARDAGGRVGGGANPRGTALNADTMARAWRGFGRLVLESLIAGALVSLVLILAVFIVATQARAAPLASADAARGSLLLADSTQARVAAPLLFTDVHMDISGITARVSVRQRFVNPTAQWREGIYVFPLPERAAVDHLHMQIGERVIEGEIKPKEEARRTYEQAKTEGRKATLVEQERPNLFTTSVAHIGPNEEIVVAIEYQEKLAYDAGDFSLRFPLAITPRYIPGDPMKATADSPDGANATGWSPRTDAVPDADRITPPVVHPSTGAVNPVAMTIDLDAGFPLARIDSTYHAVHVEQRAGNRYHLTLADGQVPAARDFELTWRPDIGAAPEAALFSQTLERKTYALLMVLPPTTADPASQRTAREITYIVDTSGSMDGVSIEQARAALLLGLDRLLPGDRFNVIEFNSVTRTLYRAPMPVERATLEAARGFVRDLRARGGTEMRPALEAAFAPPRTDALMRQVVFLTDGAVGNENELLQLIGQKLADRRLFTIGIGPAPNTYFLKKAAEAGRGTFTFIGDVREVKDRMSALIHKIESPVLTDVRVDWPAAGETFPKLLPDLYAGEPVVMTVALPAGAMAGNDSIARRVALSGHAGDKAWGTLLPFAESASADGIAVLWARDKIEALMDAKRNGAPESEIRAGVVDVALAHHLVSTYTSLVAVDVTPTASQGTVAMKTALPGNLPEGLNYESIFGALPQTATPAALQLLTGVLALLAAGLLWRFGLQGRALTLWSVVPLAFGVLAATAMHEVRADVGANRLLVEGQEGDLVPFDWEDIEAVSTEDGWYVLEKRADGATLAALPRDPLERVHFLAQRAPGGRFDAEPAEPSGVRMFYLRLPGLGLPDGDLTTIPFRRGSLVPRLERRYALALAGMPFWLTTYNGLHGKDGAYYVIDIAGERYEYLLPGRGFQHEVLFAGDIDRDGKPDFVVFVADDDAGAYYLLLSSQSQPGMNPPAALLVLGGC